MSNRDVVAALTKSRTHQSDKKNNQSKSQLTEFYKLIAFSVYSLMLSSYFNFPQQKQRNQRFGNNSFIN